MHKKNAHTDKKPFVYNSKLLGDLNAKTQKTLTQSKQLILNHNQTDISSD